MTRLSFRRETPRRFLRALARHPLSMLARLLIIASAAASALTLLFLAGYILIKGIPHLRPELFAWTYDSENVSMFPAIVTTLWTVALSLLISVPLGTGCAVYLTEYAKTGGRLVRLVRLAAETLSGIPSIVYGLFGMLFFVTTLEWGFSMLAGVFTLSIMVLPVLMRSTEEALKSVPESYREASFGLGAGKLYTIRRVVLPSAVPGILSGVILAVGRIVGETAALIYTAGTVAAIPENVMRSGRTLAVHMYVLANEGLHVGESYATAVVLLLIVLLINTLASLTAKRLAKISIAAP